MDIFLAVIVAAGGIAFVGLVLIGYINNLFSFADNVKRALGRAPPVATKEDIAEVKRALDELKEKMATAEGATEIDIEELAKAAGPDTAAGLREARALQAQNREREAIDALYEAFRRDLPPEAKAQLHILLGNSFLKLGELEQAEGHYRQALDGSRAAKLRGAEAHALGNLGRVYRRRGNLTQAKQFHLEALGIHRELRNDIAAARHLGNLAIIYAEEGDLERAEQAFVEVGAAHRQIGDLAGEASAVGNLGNVYRIRGILDRAEQCHKQALDMFREAGDRMGEGHQLGNLGIVYDNRNDFDRSEELHRQALAISQEIRDRLGEGHDLGNLANVARKRHQTQEACRFLKEAASIFEEVGAFEDLKQARAKLQELGCD